MPAKLATSQKFPFKPLDEVWYSVPIATGLASDKRRDELEVLVWKAVQDGQEFMKTEEAAKNVKAGVAVMEVLAALATVHLEVLKYQDQAVVAPLLERVRAGLSELEKTTRKESAQPSPDLNRTSEPGTTQRHPSVPSSLLG